MIAAAFIARFLYPDRFMDLDPHLMLQEYLSKWHSLPGRGVYLYSGLDSRTEKVSPEKKSVTITDGVGRRVTLPYPIRRIACLHTSSCRQFSLLGLQDKVVGVTEYILDDPAMYPGLENKANIGSV